MKQEILESDGPVEARPKEYRAELTKLRSKRIRNGTHKDMLDYMRTTRYAREVHSSFFLSVAGIGRAAYECECGFNGVFKSDKCTRCGAWVKS